MSPTERVEVVEDLYATARLAHEGAADLTAVENLARRRTLAAETIRGVPPFVGDSTWTQPCCRRWLTRCSMLGGRAIHRAVIGGLAVSLRGLPRMTVDIGLVIQAGIDDCLQIARELTSSPFMPPFEGVKEVVPSAFILPVRHRMTGVRVDLAIGMSGFERDAISRATPVMVGAETIPVVSVEDLLVMRALAGRPQHHSDIRRLIDVQRDSIDWDRYLGTARALGEAIDVDIAGRLEAARRA